MTSIHSPGDLSFLGKVYAGSQARLRSIVCTPFDYWSVTDIRKGRSDLGKPVPLDLFIWSNARPVNPAVTRVGGVPYLPRALEWPKRGGVVGEFYAQLNFMDSVDIVPRTPGGLLLVFKYYVEGLTSWHPNMYEFVWVDPEPEVKLWSADEIPQGGVGPEAALHGYRFRDADYPDLALTAPQACADGVHVLAATKVGGVPSDQQSIRPPIKPESWRFIGQVVATWPVEGVPYPVYDLPEPVRGGSAMFQALVNGPGSGVLCLYLDDHDAVQMHFSDG